MAAPETQTAARTRPTIVSPRGDTIAEPAPVVASRYRRRDYWSRRALAAADVAALLAALVVTALTSPSRTQELPFILLGAPFTLVALPVIRAYGLYDRDAKRIAHSTIDDLPGLCHALGIYALLQWAYYRVSDVPQLALEEVIANTALSLALVLVFREVTRRLVGRVLGPERTLILGDTASTRLLARKMRAHPEYDTVPVAIVRVDGPGTGRFVRAHDAPTSLSAGDLADLVSMHDVERIVLHSETLSEDTMLEILSRARQLGLKVSFLPKVVDALGPSVEIDEVEGMTLLAVTPPVLSRSSRALKRAMDIVGASLALLFGLPLMAAVATAIKVTSRGPILFRQERVGRCGQHFRLLKFRTMVADAEERRAALLAESQDPNWLLLDDDPRITPVGKFLRHTSLDELPQLWNVLRGEMSLVGPRPLIADEDSRVSGYARNRLDLTPGITGLWQVLGRTRIPFDEMVKLDYLYVTNWSLWGDLRLLLKTASIVLARRGVN